MEWIPRGLPNIHAPIPICVPPKSGQKRPATSPAPLISSPHHLQSPAAAASATNSNQSQLSANPHAISNHVIPSNHVGVPSSVIGSQPSGLSQSGNPGGSGGGGGGNSTNNSARGPFASALRNLAKQADCKDDEEPGTSRERNLNTNRDVVGTGSSNNNNSSGNSGGHNSNIQRVPSVNVDSRLDVRAVSGGNSNNQNLDDRGSAAKKQRTTVPSPTPAEKIARLNAVAPQIQPELLARSGFQPYRSEDNRHLHPAGPFQLDAYPPFSGLPGIPGAFLYPDQFHLDPRFQSMLRAGAHYPHPHAHPLYSPMAAPYSHLYSMLPAGLGLGVHPGLHERLKLEERIREEERERELQREKEREMREREQREREQREKEQREREQREKEQREREQREKEREAKEREMREKEKEQRERDRILSAQHHHYSSQLYSPLNRNLLPMGISPIGLGLRPPQSSLHGIPPMSYHSSTQRQSPHTAATIAGLNLGLLPNLTHGPPGLAHHIPPPTSLSLSHSTSGVLAHPSMAALAAHSSNPANSLSLSHAALGLSSHPGLNLTHPHISPHLSSHAQHNSASVMNNNSSAHSTNLNLSAIQQQQQHATSKQAEPAHQQHPNVSMAASNTTSSLNSGHNQLSSSMYYSHHPGHHSTNMPQHPSLASSHSIPVTTTAQGAITAAHQNSLPLSLAQHNHHTTNQLPNTKSTAHNGGRTSNSPTVASRSETTKNANNEPTTLDLTGGDRNNSSNERIGHNAANQGLTSNNNNNRTTPSIAHEINGGESSQTISDSSNSSKEGLMSSNNKDEQQVKTPPEEIKLTNNNSQPPSSVGSVTNTGVQQQNVSESTESEQNDDTNKPSSPVTSIILNTNSGNNNDKDNNLAINNGPVSETNSPKSGENLENNSIACSDNLGTTSNKIEETNQSAEIKKDDKNDSPVNAVSSVSKVNEVTISNKDASR